MKRILLIAALLSTSALAEEVTAINEVTGEVTLDNGCVIQLDDVSDIQIGDEVTLEKVEDMTVEDCLNDGEDCTLRAE